MWLRAKALWPGLACLAILAGCRSPGYEGGYAQSGALLGTGLGATAGALIGSQSGHAGAGALIGAAGGLVTGALAGDAADARVERDQALAQAQYERYARASSNQLTAYDVVAMSQSGVSDEVIISSIRSRGVGFDGDPATIIELNHAGVSPNVIRAMQNNAGSPAPLIVERPVIYTPPPPRYAPSAVLVIGARPYGRHYGHRHYHGPRGCW